MNKVILTGRIANDLELRTTKSDKSVCEFRLATNRPINRDGVIEADFVNCIVWNKQADNLVKYQGKGSLIAVFGTIRIDSFDGNDGKRKYKTYILVNEIEFLGNKNTNKQEEITEETEEESNPYKEFGESINVELTDQYDISDDELPF